jgi:maleate cis-trans isomerase
MADCLITPYATETSEQTVGFFEKAGIKVHARVRFEMNSQHLVQPTINEFRHACAIASAGYRPDCIFISCMGLRTRRIYRQLALGFNFPVLTRSEVVADQLKGTIL